MLCASHECAKCGTQRRPASGQLPRLGIVRYEITTMTHSQIPCAGRAGAAGRVRASAAHGCLYGCVSSGAACASALNSTSIGAQLPARQLGALWHAAMGQVLCDSRFSRKCCDSTVRGCCKLGLADVSSLVFVAVALFCTSE